MKQSKETKRLRPECPEETLVHERTMPTMPCVSFQHPEAGDVDCVVINPEMLRGRKITPNVVADHCLIETTAGEEYLANPRKRRPVLRVLARKVSEALRFWPSSPEPAFT